MLQRGLAILLSVCMLAGNGSTAYAVSPQMDVQAVGDMQNGSDIGDVSEDTDGVRDDSAEGVSAGESGLTEEMPSADQDAAGEAPSEDNGTAGEAPGEDNGTAEKAPGEGNGTAEDVSGEEQGAAAEVPGEDQGTAEEAPGEDNGTADTEEDGQSSVSGNDSEDDIEVVEDETLLQSTTAVSGVKDEELTLTADAPQTVTLAASEKQWLSFTAPEKGYFKFYSTMEDNSFYGSRELRFYSYKTDNEFTTPLAYDTAYGGIEQQLNYTYSMKADETVYLLVSNGGSSTCTLTMHAEKAAPSAFTVDKNVKEDSTLYTLTAGDDYQLKLDMKPFYRTVKVSMELCRADGSALTDGNSYKIDYCYVLDENRRRSGKWDLDGRNNYNKSVTVEPEMTPGEKFWVSELALRDSNDNILAMLGTDGQEIAVNTMATDKLGVLTEVAAEDAFIAVSAEMISDQNGRIRYRKKDESDWTYYKDAIYYWQTNNVKLAAESDTDYVIELTGTDGETVYDTAETRTKAFAATGITTEVTNITPTSATIKVTVGAYTGSKKYIRAGVTYTDAMEQLTGCDGWLDTRENSNTITLGLNNLRAGTEYKDLEVWLGDTDDYTYIEYAAYSTKVSFTTKASALTAEKINVTATPDAEDGIRAVLRIQLEGVTEGIYPYAAKYYIAGSKDWAESTSSAGSDQLNTGNGYTAEQTLTSLLGNTVYEVLIMVDGIPKVVSFTTAAAAVAAQVEVEPLMQGVRVKATVTGASSESYRIQVRSRDPEKGSLSYPTDGNCLLTGDEAWTGTKVFCSSSMRPNAENEWQIKIVDNDNGRTIYEKYMMLEAARQEIVLTAENVGRTTATIGWKPSVRDESMTAYVRVASYYREKGAAQWIRWWDCNYGDFRDINLSNLKDDTEYEFKLVPQNHPDDILAQTTFRTLKDTRTVSVSAESIGYTSGRIHWTFDAGENTSDGRGYIYLYYRKKGDAAWTYVTDRWVYGITRGQTPLTDLNAGTAYEVLAEIKDNYNTTAGVGTVKSATAEFTTASVDHVLTAKPVEGETKAASVALDVQLTKPTGKLENRAKAAVTLTPVNGGDTRSKEVFLNKDNEYKAKLVINGLLPETKYAVAAKLYESESNRWMALKDYALGEVTTAKADAPGSLTLSETELAINKGTSKKLTVTVQPEEAAAGLTWTSSDTAVASVDRYGKVTALKAGKADITVSAAAAAAGQEKASAVCHVTVQDYEICVKDGNSYDSIPSTLSRAQKRTLAVRDNAANADLQGVTWTSSNLQTAKISGEGLLEPQNYGRAFITAQTADGITLREEVNVVNEIQGFSITRPETDNDKYQAIRTAEAVYQVAAGETYQVGCVLSPAYTDQYDSSVGMSGDNFNWKADKSEVTIKKSGDLTNIDIPAAVSGTVKVTATMKAEEYKDKSFTITLDVLKKPEITAIPDTYAYLNYSDKLTDAGLPANWQWKQPDTLLYRVGVETFTACYTEDGYYPYEKDVDVIVRSVYTSIQTQGNYSSKKRAYIVKKGTPLKMTASVSSNDIPTPLYERGPIVAKDAAKVNVTDNKDGSYSVTPSEKGTYTVSATTAFKKAAYTKQGGQYALTAGEKAMDLTAGLQLMAVDTAPIQSIRLAVAPDSEEKVTISEGAIEYDITAQNAATKDKARVIRLNVSAFDTDGNPVENPKINYSVSDTSVVGVKKEGTDKLVLTIPKGADGLAKIIATAQDDLGRSTQLAVRVKDYTPRVSTEKVTINENYTYSKSIAQVLLPYMEEDNDRIEKVSLVETADGKGADEVAGLAVSASQYDDYDTYRDDKYDIYLRVKDKAQIKKTGSLKYYLAVQTKAYGGMVFVPVQIKLETGMPTAALKQSGKVNVFYTDTTHLDYYDAVSMGVVEVSSNAYIDSVRWAPGDGSASAANTEFVIEKSYAGTSKHGKYTRKYMIQQHRPVLDSTHKPSDAATKGTLYIKLSGYGEEIAQPFTIQTVYKKPKLKVADYKVCPALGQVSDSKYIYTNAAKKGNWMFKGSDKVWRDYSDVLCPDEDVEILPDTNVGLRYTGTNNKKTQLTLYSDYWYEQLTVPANIKVAKSKVKLSAETVTLNTAYPAETTQTAATTRIYNAETGKYVSVSDVGIEGTNAQAQQMLDQSLINMDYMSSRLSVSVNYAKAMGNDQFKPGSYKYKLTPYYGDTKLNDVTLTVKIIDQEAAVKVSAKGTIDLLKLNYEGDGYNDYENPVVTVTPAFQNLDSSYDVQQAELCGAYKDLFEIAYRYDDGTLEIVPSSFGRLKAGKGYTLSVKYTVKDAYGEGGETITVTSNTFTIKPKQSVPKVTSSVKQLTLYASAKGRDKGEKMYLYVPHDYKKGYYAISSVYGSLDVNKDGRTDLRVETIDTYAGYGEAKINVYVEDADAVKAAAKGTAYKIPVTVSCVGRDGRSKDASTTVSVVVKK